MSKIKQIKHLPISDGSRHCGYQQTELCDTVLPSRDYLFKQSCYLTYHQRTMPIELQTIHTTVFLNMDT